MAEPEQDFDRTSAARKRTDWAEDRTVLANERTFGSWVRTGFGAIAIGLGFHALFGRIHPLWVPRAVATAFLVIAIIVFIAADRRACIVIRRLHTHEVETVKIGVVRLITVVAVAATVALIASIWLLSPGGYH
jgi:putative membrane protein